MKKHTPRKRFGQHFLQDNAIIDQIFDALLPKKDEIFVEIGPGHGILTHKILPRVKKLHVIEIDRDLAEKLIKISAAFNQLIVHPLDVLQFDFLALSKSEQNAKLRIFGNLPYNISSPLLFHLFKHLAAVSDMHFMFQKEMADRLSAQISTKNYGRLTVMTQYFCTVEHLFDIPKDAFKPKPKVHSSFVRLIPHTKPPYPAKNFSVFSNLVRDAFNKRRKMIKNSLDHLINEEMLKQLQIDPQKRPEDLSVAEYTALANSL